MKLCKDCKHMLVSQTFPDDPGFAKCELTVQTVIEPVMGVHQTKYDYCNVQRVDIDGRCGIDAKYWEAKQ